LPFSRFVKVDRLAPAADALEVQLLRDYAIGHVRAPHRHDFHELFWTRAGTGSHAIDGRRSPIRPDTVTLVGRGQVHVFEQGTGITGAIVRFSDELLYGRADAGWLLTGRQERTIAVPEPDRLDALIALLREERGDDARRHLLSVLLLWLERWYGPGDVDTALYRRFARVLERDFARRHDAQHYADALAVPPAALSKALREVTGQGTKELVRDRVLLEAARLLRFSDLSVGEIAARVGFEDPLYFSRAFKRRYGVAPTGYR
jgi:AraC family transcriptional activator of pobA